MEDGLPGGCGAGGPIAVGAVYRTVGCALSGDQHLWWRHWAQVSPFFAFPVEIRKGISTTNAVMSLNRSLRKAVKARGAFPSEDAALKMTYLALRKVIAKWEFLHHGKAALNRVTLLWEDRIQAARVRGECPPSPF